jgi:soluble lytic murein transglycosylase
MYLRYTLHYLRHFGRLAVLCAVALLLMPQAACANNSDSLITQAADAFRTKNSKQLAQLLQQSRGHPLEAWVAYWEQTHRIRDASFDEFRGFAQTYPGAYVTDRLRNDWLLELGRRGTPQDLADFGSEVGNFIMRDDAQVDCYELLRRHRGNEAVAADAWPLWLKQRDAEGCNTLGEALLRDGKLTDAQAWERMRRFFEQDRLRSAQRLLAYVPDPASAVLLTQAYEQPAKALTKSVPQTAVQRHMAVLAGVRLAKQSPENVALWLEQNAGSLSRGDRAYLWGQVGRAAALALDPRAAGWFANTGDAKLSDDVLAWKVRAALRAGDFKQVLLAVPIMSGEQLRDATWTYWHGYALAKQGRKAEAEEYYRSIASPYSFYGKLATEELGQRVAVPARVELPSADDVAQARRNPGVARALRLFQLGLRSEAVREWNFTLRGMNDAQLHATAEVACQSQVWDRCINTSERTASFADMRQRFAMPYREAIRAAAKEHGLEEAYIFGLIRQESRFITDARSLVGASGLMQLMPATAKWTAKKAGIDLSTGVNDVTTNVSLGSAYLKLLKDEFDGSEALAAAGYNAGPGRPRNWRNMANGQGKIDAAIFAENVPFNETRDYVKRVLSNATLYAAMITGKSQSLKSRLGAIGPRSPGTPENKDLP